jgi:hypothetical protein
MSHISKIEIVIHSLADLKDACGKLGYEFIENQKTYKWYGRWVGDTPLPEGIKIEDIGKCNHAIRVPGCTYEIGIIRRNNHYILLWDYYYVGGLTEKIGENAGKLKQAYTVSRVRKEAVRKGYRVMEKKMDQGVRLVLTV